MTQKRLIFLPVVLLVFSGLNVKILAQTNEDTYSKFQFNFSTPGARASAMGRAFVGLADDATAAVANPAGLVNLRKPQVYFEYKNTDLRIKRAASTTALFPPIRTETFGDNINSFSFFNFTMPVGENVALSFTRHEFLNYKETYKFGPRSLPTPIARSLGLAFLPIDATVDFKGESYAGSLAVRLHKAFSAGLTISADKLRGKTRETRRDIIFGPNFRADPSDVKPSDIVFNQSDLDDDDYAMGIVAGALAKPAEGFSIGFVYSHGPEFHFQQNFRLNLGAFEVPQSNKPLSPFLDASGKPIFPKQIVFNVPDRFGVGFAYNPTQAPRLLLVFDAVAIKYSDLVKRLEPVTLFTDVTRKNYEIQDVTEVHYGGEFQLVKGRNPVFVRVGGFTNPDHSLRFVGNTGNELFNEIETARFNLEKRETENGFTFGGGFAIGTTVQADAAFLRIKSIREFVASLAIRF